MKKKFKMIGLIFLGLFVAILLFAIVYASTSPQMGGRLSEYDSPNFKNGKFMNLVPTSISTGESSMIRSMYEFFFSGSDEKYPNITLPSQKINLDLIKSLKKDEVSITWLGHSTMLINSKDVNIITDPILNGKKIPPLRLGPKPFPYNNSYSVEDLGKIDFVLISHDHYDHLDMETIKKLKDSKFYVPFGVKAHLLRWGINEENIFEFDWYDEKEIQKNLKLIFAPTRHFSGRGIFNRDKTLWGSWIIKLNNKTIYFGGDSGYFDEFKKIGKKYGPFDIIMLDNGQYNKAWQQIHLLPKEAVQVGLDMNAGAILPMHNSKYVLALHSWYEPLDRITTEGEKKNVKITTPIIGETFLLNEKLPETKWWR